MFLLALCYGTMQMMLTIPALNLEAHSQQRQIILENNKIKYFIYCFFFYFVNYSCNSVMQLKQFFLFEFFLAIELKLNKNLKLKKTTLKLPWQLTEIDMLKLKY